MKKPAKPPPHQIREPDLGTLSAHFLGVDPTVDGRYRHWDKLRRLESPSGLNHKEWWVILKHARSVGRKNVPLKDRQGRSFSYVVPDAAQAMLHELSMGLGAQLKLPEKVVNTDMRDQYYVSSLIEESIASSQLEGASTTRKVAEDMLRSGRKPKTQSEIMIRNNFDAMRRIGELLDRPLLQDIVFELHAILTRGTLEDDGESGRFRTADERIVVEDTETFEVVHEPPSATELPERMREMCRFANGETPEGFLHPIVRAIILHFWLAHDHPFTDGNGRVARALFYWSMRRAGHWLSEFLSISSVILRGPARYARAFLYTESDDNDLTYFILYHLDVLKRAADQLQRYINRRSEQVRSLTQRLQGLQGLNHRQRELIAHALRHPRQEYTIESHRTSHAIVYQTARRDLLDLEDRGYLHRHKRGHEFVFTPVVDLEKRLRRG